MNDHQITPGRPSRQSSRPADRPSGDAFGVASRGAPHRQRHAGPDLRRRGVNDQNPTELSKAAAAYLEARRADATHKSYETAWRAFEAWCSRWSMPAEHVLSVAGYLTHLAESGLSVASVERALSAIGAKLEDAGEADPRRDAAIKALVTGIRRKRGRPPKRKSPLMAAHMLAIVRKMQSTERSAVKLARDRCLLLLGFAAALRRSELVALDLEDVAELRADDGSVVGLRVLVRRSKTDQEGRGRVVGVSMGSHPETCPVRAVAAWRAMVPESTGPLLRYVGAGDRVTRRGLGDRQVARIVKRAAASVGLDPSRFAGHSLRAGLATSAAKAGKSDRAIMAQTGHKSHAMVQVYVREAKLVDEDNASNGIGL